jgi:hypothetical protein
MHRVGIFLHDTKHRLRFLFLKMGGFVGYYKRFNYHLPVIIIHVINIILIIIISNILLYYRLFFIRAKFVIGLWAIKLACK